MGLTVSVLSAIFSEPPFRLAAKAVLRVLPGMPLEARARWDAVAKPQYLTGVLHAAVLARRQGYREVAVIEFGVAEGRGLLALQQHAAAVERLTGMRIRVYGFDTGGGLPDSTGDYRDHPDIWQGGDFTMDVPGLTARLERSRTTLVLGDVREKARTCPIAEPLGFIASDLDFYSSTAGALQILCRADVRRLPRVAMYFDDVRFDWSHRGAGELLAIEEFNRDCAEVKIDRWRGLADYRPFPNAPWLEGMYLAHDLVALNRSPKPRPAARMSELDA